MALIRGASGEFFGTLFSSRQYKPGQGALARWMTFAVLAILTLYGCYSFWFAVSRWSYQAKLAAVLIGGLLFLWFAYRLTHYPRFADFLITTQAEMNKVSWPTRNEVWISTIVVLVISAILAAYMFALDWFWQLILYMIRVLEFRTFGLGDNA